MNNNLYEDDEIDLMEIFFELRKHMVIICLAAVLGGLLAFCATKFFMTPVYTAENSMLVITKETTLASLADLQMGSQLTNDYKVLATSRPVLESVIKKLDLNMSYGGLKGSISIDNPSNTRILVLQVTHESPELALKIVRAVTSEASAYIGDMVEVVPPKIIDEGVLPISPTSPNVKKNTAMGILLGILLSCGIVALKVILDDTIKSDEDIEKRLGLSTLSVVPDRKDYVGQSKAKSKGKIFLEKTNIKKE